MIEKNKYQRVIDIFKENCPDEFGNIALGSVRLQKLDDYLYFVEYGGYDYAKGFEYFKKYVSRPGACSSVRNGEYYGRNFDYYYSNACEFVVHTLANGGRHGSLGIAQGHKKLTKDFVESYKWDEAYDILPFITMDGINDAGVACNINLVPAGDKGHTTGTNPDAKITMSTYMIVRYILDYAGSANEAVELIQNINWVAPKTEESETEVHLMIADNSDSSETYVVEFVDNEVKIFSSTDDDYPDIPGDPILVNFYLDGWNGEVVTGFETPGGIAKDDTTLTAHAQGCERYKILSDGYPDIPTAVNMAALMQSVWYSKAYLDSTDPFWYSEFTGNSSIGDLTIYQDAAHYAPVKSAVIDAWENKERNGYVWHTMHSTLYNMDNLTMEVWTQENASKSIKLKLQPSVPLA